MRPLILVLMVLTLNVSALDAEGIRNAVSAIKGASNAFGAISQENIEAVQKEIKVKLATVETNKSETEIIVPIMVAAELPHDTDDDKLEFIYVVGLLITEANEKRFRLMKLKNT